MPKGLGLPQPAVEDRDLYEQVLRNAGPRLDDGQVKAIIDKFYDADDPFSGAGIARDGNVSGPTARRYRNKLIAALENSPTVALKSVADPEPIKEPSPEVKHKAKRVVQKSIGKTRRENRRVTGEETSEIVDAYLREIKKSPLDFKPSDVKALVDTKMKLEDMTNPVHEEIIDPRKVLGDEGLKGAERRYFERFVGIATHRAELPDLWKALCTAVDGARAEDEQGSAA